MEIKDDRREKMYKSNSYKKQKPHDPTASYDGYDESDDTEEKARGGRLQKAREIKT